MILLVDNYDSFTYNLAQYLGTFAEVQVLRNDDVGLEVAAQAADALVLSPGPGWPADSGKMEALIETFAKEKPILGFALGIKPSLKPLAVSLDLLIRSCTANKVRWQ